MKEDIKKDWVTALRSGDYKQGPGVLYNDVTNRYCCLGVLCEVKGYKSTYDGHLSADILKETGISTIQQSDLITLNDSRRKNFDEIADYIEENL